MHLAKTNTKPGDKIFTYPEFVALYALTDRGCPTVSCSHNIDVVNDSFARQEAQTLLAHPPAILIYQPETEAFLAGEERLWRHGQGSGNRSIIQAVEGLARHYHYVGSYRVADNSPVQVYLRP